MQDFEFLDQLGHGSFGEVYLAIERSGTAQAERKVAVKVINLEEQDDEMEAIQHEIAVLSNCHCAQLTKYFGSYVVGTSLWIVMEYMEGGSLGELMEVSRGGVLDEATIAWAMRELCLALLYLHGERKIHRDIKAQNVLVSGMGEVKLADFGVTVQLTDTITKRQTFVGTPFWMAPEVITQSSYDLKADIWSVGITAIELASGGPPYGKVHPMKVLFLIPKNPPPILDGDYSQRFKDFVGLCLQKDPAARPTAAELLKHPFLRQAPESGRENLKGLVEQRAKMQLHDKLHRPSALSLDELPPEMAVTGDFNSVISGTRPSEQSVEALPTPPRKGHRAARHFDEDMMGSDTSHSSCGNRSSVPVRTRERRPDSWDFTVASMEELNGLEDVAFSPSSPGSTTPVFGLRRRTSHPTARSGSIFGSGNLPFRLEPSEISSESSCSTPTPQTEIETPPHSPHRQHHMEEIQTACGPTSPGHGCDKGAVGCAMHVAPTPPSPLPVELLTDKIMELAVTKRVGAPPTGAGDIFCESATLSRR